MKSSTHQKGKRNITNIHKPKAMDGDRGEAVVSIQSSPFFTGMFYLYIRNVSVKKGEKQIISHHILIYEEPLPANMVKRYFKMTNNNNKKENMKYTKVFNANYASEVMNDLPSHAYIDKTTCGVGMTSVAIEENCDTLLLVPTKLLVENKANQYPSSRCDYDVQGVTGDVDDYTIQYYFKQCQGKQPAKYICTYDSFAKMLPFAQMDNVRIVVDESDKVFAQSHLKSDSTTEIDVLNYMLKELEPLQERVTMISSTPVPVNYFKGTYGEWIMGLDQYKFSWTTSMTVTPMMCKRRMPTEALKKEVIQPIVAGKEAVIGDRKFRKTIIFLNSVTSICKTIKECGIKDCSGIICSNSNEQETKLKKTKLDGIRIKDFSHLPTFTFITSTGFQGIDLDDPEAMNVVVSSGNTKDYLNGDSPSMMLDLRLDIKQAVSRNRNRSNPNSDRFVFFYNLDIFDIDVPELIGKIDTLQQRIEDYCKGMNIGFAVVDPMGISEIYKRYTYIDGGKLFINLLNFNFDKYLATNVIQLYQSGFALMSNMSSTFSGPINVAKPRESRETSYKPIYEKYQAQIDGAPVVWTPEELACENYILVDRCYKEFGKVFHDSDYAKEIVNASDSFGAVDMESEVKKVIKPGKYNCKDLKEMLQEVYTANGYYRIAKATDIIDYYPDSSRPTSSSTGKYIIVR